MRGYPSPPLGETDVKREDFRTPSMNFLRKYRVLATPGGTRLTVEVCNAPVVRFYNKEGKQMTKISDDLKRVEAEVVKAIKKEYAELVIDSV